MSRGYEDRAEGMFDFAVYGLVSRTRHFFDRHILVKPKKPKRQNIKRNDLSDKAKRGRNPHGFQKIIVGFFYRRLCLPPYPRTARSAQPTIFPQNLLAQINLTTAYFGETEKAEKTEIKRKQGGYNASGFIQKMASAYV